jgi:hypothetical protein
MKVRSGDMLPKYRGSASQISVLCTNKILRRISRAMLAAPRLPYAA